MIKVLSASPVLITLMLDVTKLNPYLIQLRSGAKTCQLIAAALAQYEVPSIFRLTKGSIHATSFSFDC